MTAPQTPDGTVLPIPGAVSSGHQAREFTLEMPPGMKLLSANSRMHWAERSRRTARLKEAACWLARKDHLPRMERVSIIVEHNPPDRRHRDADNAAAASAKPCIDGLVLAGVLADDDCPGHVASVTYRVGPVWPRGRLVLIITEVTGGEA